MARPAWLLAVVAALAVLALPWVANPYIVYVVKIGFIYVILVVGLNLLLGYAGQFAFANAALFGIGAYAVSLLQVRAGLSFWASLPLGVMVTILVGIGAGLPALRLAGLYLALTTLAFALLTQWFLFHAGELTFGGGGFRVPPPSFGWLGLSHDLGVYYLGLVLVTLLVALARNLIRSRVGRAFIALRDSEVAAEAMGISPTKYKTLAFGLSAVYAGIAGGLYTATLNFVAPETFDLFQMVLHFAMLVVGGQASIWGSVLGVTLILGLQEGLRAAKEIQEIVFGALLLAAIVFLPDGIVSLVKRYFTLFRETVHRPSGERELYVTSEP